MWVDAGGGRWRRDDGGSGWLTRVGDLLAEAHLLDDTVWVHTYRHDPAAAAAALPPGVSAAATGGPLDDCVYLGTTQVPLSTVDPGTAGPRNEARVFDFLSTRAAAAAASLR